MGTVFSWSKNELAPTGWPCEEIETPLCLVSVQGADRADICMLCNTIITKVGW